MNTLVKEEKTERTVKKIFVDEEGKENVEYYFYDRYGKWRRTNVSMWAITKFRETHNTTIELPLYEIFA